MVKTNLVFIPTILLELLLGKPPNSSSWKQISRSMPTVSINQKDSTRKITLNPTKCTTIAKQNRKPPLTQSCTLKLLSKENNMY